MRLAASAAGRAYWYERCSRCTLTSSVRTPPSTVPSVLIMRSPMDAKRACAGARADLPLRAARDANPANDILFKLLEPLNKSKL